MRTLLLGTTALVGAGLVQLATPAIGHAAEIRPGGALDVSISGFARFRAHGGDLDNARLNDAISTGLDFSNDTEVHVILKGKHDATGIAYGGTVEFEADTNRNDNTDETWIFLSGGFGEFRFGDEDGPADNSAVGAHTLAAGTGGLDGSVIDTWGGVKTFEPLNTNDATKIRYYTPSFGGFQAGVAYTPNQTGFDSGANNGDSLAPKDVTVGDVVEGALVYKGTFGGVGINTSVVGLVGDVKNEDVAGGDDYWALQGGAVIDLFGFKIGGSYLTEEAGAIEVDAFTAGVGAKLGPANVSVNYGQIIDSDSVVLNGNTLDNPWSVIFSADVGLMPGVVLGGDVSYFNNDVDGEVINADDDDGWQGIVRLALAF